MMQPRPKVLPGKVTKVLTGCGNLYVTVTENPGAFEVFAQLGKAGGCPACWNEAGARLVSMCLRAGINKENIIKQLEGIMCSQPSIECRSCPDGIAQVLKGKKEEAQDGELPR